MEFDRCTVKELVAHPPAAATILLFTIDPEDLNATALEAAAAAWVTAQVDAPFRATIVDCRRTLAPEEWMRVDKYLVKKVPCIRLVWGEFWVCLTQPQLWHWSVPEILTWWGWTL